MWLSSGRCFGKSDVFLSCFVCKMYNFLQTFVYPRECRTFLWFRFPAGQHKLVQFITASVWLFHSTVLLQKCDDFFFALSKRIRSSTQGYYFVEQDSEGPTKSKSKLKLLLRCNVCIYFLRTYTSVWLV